LLVQEKQDRYESSLRTTWLHSFPSPFRDRQIMRFIRLSPRVAQIAFSFYLTAPIDESIPHSYNTPGSLTYEGAPTRRIYAWGVVSYRHIPIRPADKNWEQRNKSPTRKPDAWGTRFIFRHGTWASRPQDKTSAVGQRSFVKANKTLGRAFPVREQVGTGGVGDPRDIGNGLVVPPSVP